MGVYYTKNDEDQKVYHVYGNCPEGEKIEPENKVWAVRDRRLCEVCDTMHN